MLNLNLGCGKTLKRERGWVNLDIVPPADILCDVTKGLPQLDDTVDLIEADNLLEHFDNNEFLTVMNDCWRVLKRGGVFWFRVPNALAWMDGAFGDPTHKRFFVPRSFLYFTQTQQYDNFGKSYGFKPWKLEALITGNFFECKLTPIK
jgi:SAM-dependent methyltransferase